MFKYRYLQIDVFVNIVPFKNKIVFSIYFRYIYLQLVEKYKINSLFNTMLTSTIKNFVMHYVMTNIGLFEISSN